MGNFLKEIDPVVSHSARASLCVVSNAGLSGGPVLAAIPSAMW